MTTSTAPSDPRTDHPAAHGADGLNVIDRAGIWLRTRSVRAHVRRERPQRMLDLGCGFQAPLLSTFRGTVPELVGVDLEVDPALAGTSGLSFVTEPIEDALAAFDEGAFDLVTMLSVLEHLPSPEAVLTATHRVLAPGGTVIVHVPSWRGKPVLEWLAFRRGIGTASIDDHRMYYDVPDLWPLVVRAGFRPKDVVMRRHTAGCALTAIARRAA
jgi:SAM-dependent methyltransferase